MFKEIRNKITFFNTIILIAFLIIFILAIIFIIRWSMIKSGESYLKQASEQIINSTERNEETNVFRTNIHNEIGCDYLIWNNDLGIIEQTVNNKELINESYELINSRSKINSFTLLVAYFLY